MQLEKGSIFLFFLTVRTAVAFAGENFIVQFLQITYSILRVVLRFRIPES
jgi:hypothetical protein